MEKIAEGVVQSIKDASNILSEVSTVVLDRFRNPYILTFSIAWVIFNWRPVTYFIFAKVDIEDKIEHINSHYSSIYQCFIWPFAVAIIYLFILPYLNTANDWFLQKSVKKRADIINQQIIDKIERKEKEVKAEIVKDKNIAIEEDKKQEAIQSAREGSDHNKFVKDLQDTVNDLNNRINSERNKRLSVEKRRTDEINELEIVYRTNIQALESNLDGLRKENDRLTNKLIQYEPSNNSFQIYIKDLFEVEDGRKIVEVYTGTKNSDVWYIDLTHEVNLPANVANDIIVNYSKKIDLSTYDMDDLYNTTSNIIEKIKKRLN